MEIISNIDISLQDHAILFRFLDEYLPDTEIWAFGSRVKGTARPQSDLDLVAFITPKQASLLSDLRDALAESNLSFRVDLHSWDDLPENFKSNILQQYVVVRN
jgi:predicted nucleotidyltransferase